MNQNIRFLLVFSAFFFPFFSHAYVNPRCHQPQGSLSIERIKAELGEAAPQSYQLCPKYERQVDGHWKIKTYLKPEGSLDLIPLSTNPPEASVLAMATEVGDIETMNLCLDGGVPLQVMTIQSNASTEYGWVVHPVFGTPTFKTTPRSLPLDLWSIAMKSCRPDAIRVILERGFIHRNYREGFSFKVDADGNALVDPATGVPIFEIKLIDSRLEWMENEIRIMEYFSQSPVTDLRLARCRETLNVYVKWAQEKGWPGVPPAAPENPESSASN